MNKPLKEKNMTLTAAPSPFNPSEEIEVFIDESSAGKVSEIGYTTKIHQMYYNILGYPPPVNNIGFHEKDSPITDTSSGIMDTHSVFQGIRRPHIKENADQSVFVYISNPEFCYIYEPGMVCVAKRRGFPKNTVFAIYLNLNEEQNIGQIFNWEILKSDPAEPKMPENFDKRYDEIRWKL